MASALRTISRVVAGTQRPDTVATKGALPSRGQNYRERERGVG